MVWKIALFAGVALLGVGEVVPIGGGGIYIQWGSLAILATAVAKLFAELGAQRKDRDKEREAHERTLDTLCKRWDGWEQIRHADHRELSTALAQLREHYKAAG